MNQFANVEERRRSFTKRKRITTLFENVRESFLYHGDGINSNKLEAARYFKLAADKGNEKSINKFACMLEYGDGVQQNKSEATRYYKISADKGNAVAMNMYALLLNSGEGVKVNKSEELKLFMLFLAQKRI